MITMDNNSRIIVALDYADEQSAMAFVDQLAPAQCRLKVGNEFFTRCGPALVEKFVSRGFDVFLDLKFHDIPNTVARACEAAADMGVWMLNVHALGGRDMMEAAQEALDKRTEPPLLIAVTVLTSLQADDLKAVGIHGSVNANVISLAGLARQSGLAGVVCSPQEAGSLRKQYGKDFLLVTPGIRPQDSDSGDQKRTMTPGEAIQAGADYLVIGRPITMADNPVQKMLTIESEITAIHE